MSNDPQLLIPLEHVGSLFSNPCSQTPRLYMMVIGAVQEVRTGVGM